MTSTRSAADTGLPTTIIPFPSQRARSPAASAPQVEPDPWRRCAATALTLRQFAGLDAAGRDAMVGDMMRADPSLVAKLLERSAADLRFLDGAIIELSNLDGQIAAAADRVLAQEAHR